jgi:hypothetical protein
MNARQQQALMLFYRSRQTVIGLRHHLERGRPTGSLNFEAILQRAEKRLEEAKGRLLKLGLSLEDFWSNHDALAAYDAQHELEFERRLSCWHYVEMSLQMPEGYEYEPCADCCPFGGHVNSHDYCLACEHYREITPEERHSTGWGGP